MIIPSIDLIKGHAVQLVGGKEMKLDAGDPRPFAETFRVAGEIAVVDLDAALSKGDNKAVILDLIKIAPCRVGGGIRDVDTALWWLNQGATKIVLGTAAVPEILSQLPKERVIAALDAVHGEVVVKGWTTKTGKTVKDQIVELKPYVSGFLVTFVEREGRLQGVDMGAIAELAEVVGKEHRLTVAGGVTTVEDVAKIDALGVDAQVGMALYTNIMDIGSAIACTLKSDRPDGLYPTVVTDEAGKCLGLVYSSKESVVESVRTLTGVYYSRSRKEIWHKGKTSGDTQKLKKIEVDCDRDALRFVVEQGGAGSFCHLKQRSCFYAADTGLTGLMNTLESRKTTAPEGSYTKKLFEDSALLKAKLVEEAYELADAKTKQEVTGEAADVIYFALVAAAKAGVTISDIEKELDLRSLKVSRRKGDAKANILAEIAMKE